MKVIRVTCPAKINLGLRVLGKRADGFHEIVTVFQTIDLADELEAEEAEGLSLVCDDSGLAADGTNLVLRAAELLRATVPAAAGRGAAFRLRKKIPVGGGLGGGSADAAGALLALDSLWQLGLGRAELARRAAAVGSDVPFLIDGGTALGTGRGERLAPLPSCAGRLLVLGTPPFPLGTAEVYHALAAALTPVEGGVSVTRLFVNFAERNDFALAGNDLEAPAFAMRGELSPFRDALRRSGAEVALLSGSGSTVFGMYDSGADTAAIVAELQDAFPRWSIRAAATTAHGARLVSGVPSEPAAS